jgi:hypothetical protein
MTPGRWIGLTPSRWIVVAPRRPSRRRQMPVPAERTKVRLAPTFHSHHGGRVQRVTLRTVPPLANAHPLTFLAIRFFHGESASHHARSEAQLKLQPMPAALGARASGPQLSEYGQAARAPMRKCSRRLGVVRIDRLFITAGRAAVSSTGRLHSYPLSPVASIGPIADDPAVTFYQPTKTGRSPHVGRPRRRGQRRRVPEVSSRDQHRLRRRPFAGDGMSPIDGG